MKNFTGFLIAAILASLTCCVAQRRELHFGFTAQPTPALNSSSDHFLRFFHLVKYGKYEEASEYLENAQYEHYMDTENSVHTYDELSSQHQKTLAALANARAHIENADRETENLRSKIQFVSNEKAKILASKQSIEQKLSKEMNKTDSLKKDIGRHQRIHRYETRTKKKLQEEYELLQGKYDFLFNCCVLATGLICILAGLSCYLCFGTRKLKSENEDLRNDNEVKTTRIAELEESGGDFTELRAQIETLKERLDTSTEKMEETRELMQSAREELQKSHKLNENLVNLCEQLEAEMYANSHDAPRH